MHQGKSNSIVDVSSDSNKLASVMLLEKPTIQRNKIDTNDGMELIFLEVAYI